VAIKYAQFSLFILCSIHALKDEAFLRATLQKQAARLHHASVTYAVSRAIKVCTVTICTCVFIFPLSEVLTGAEFIFYGIVGLNLGHGKNVQML
jgi:hypothetical protein